MEVFFLSLFSFGLFQCVAHLFFQSCATKFQRLELRENKIFALFFLFVGGEERRYAITPRRALLE